MGNREKTGPKKKTGKGGERWPPGGNLRHQNDAESSRCEGLVEQWLRTVRGGALPGIVLRGEAAGSGGWRR